MPDTEKGANGIPSTQWPTVQLGVRSQEQVCTVVSYAIQHLLFAKGQTDQPIAVLRRRRAQQKEAEQELETEGDCAGPSNHHNRRKKAPRKTYCTRRTERRLDETLRDVDRLYERLSCAVQSLASEGSRRAESVTLLLRMGQCPSSTLVKQQYAIHIKGLFRLPRTTQEAEAEEQEQRKKSMVDVQRQVFGGKAAAASASLPSSKARLPALERKLVRFLLNASVDDAHGLGRSLSAPLAPTRTQVFLSAQAQFRATGWAPRPSINFKEQMLGAQRGSDPCEADATEPDSAPAEAEDVPGVPTDDMDQLTQALSPLKRKMMSPFAHSSMRKAGRQSSYAALRQEPLGMLFGGAAGNPAPALVEVDSGSTDEATTLLPTLALTCNERTDDRQDKVLSIDEKRQARRAARVKLAAARSPPAKRGTTVRQSRATTKRQPLSSGFVIDCCPTSGQQGARNDGHIDEAARHDDHLWFSSDVIIKAYVA